MKLELRELGVRLRRRALVENVNFEARPGELIVLAGPNGAGKTTLLRAIAHLIPSEGGVLLDGRPLSAMSASERARLLAYLPQGHAACWPVSVRDVVAIARQPAASSLMRLTAADKAAIDRALTATETAAFAERPITELSGGERARVMLARALAAETPLLLADEPTASLDPAHQLAVMQLLARTAHQGKLVIAVIHDLALAGRFADRVLVLDRGRLVAAGPARDVLTSDLIARVFHVESVRVTGGGREVLLPWSLAGGQTRL